MWIGIGLNGEQDLIEKSNTCMKGKLKRSSADEDTQAIFIDPFFEKFLKQLNASHYLIDQ